MRDGHPYLTERLDEQRAEQRRILGSIPDWVLDPNRYGPNHWEPSAQMAASDRARNEILVRSLAEETLATEGLTECLKVWEQETAADRLYLFLDRETSERPGHNLEAARRQLIDLISGRATTSPPAKIPMEITQQLAALILLLTWADALADDGYADPRLEQRWKSEAEHPVP